MGFKLADLINQGVVCHTATQAWSSDDPHARCIQVNFKDSMWFQKIRESMPQYAFFQSGDQHALSMLEYLVLASYHHFQDRSHQAVYSAIRGMVKSFVDAYALPLVPLVQAHLHKAAGESLAVDAWVIERQRAQWLLQMSVWSGIFDTHMLKPLFSVQGKTEKLVVKALFTDQGGRVDTGVCSGHSLLSTVACTGPKAGRLQATQALMRRLHHQKSNTDDSSIHFSTNSLKIIDFYEIQLKNHTSQSLILAALGQFYSSNNQYDAEFAADMYDCYKQYSESVDPVQMSAIHQKVLENYPNRSVAASSPPRPSGGWKSSPSTPGSTTSRFFSSEKAPLLVPDHPTDKPCCVIL